MWISVLFKKITQLLFCWRTQPCLAPQRWWLCPPVPAETQRSWELWTDSMPVALAFGHITYILGWSLCMLTVLFLALLSFCRQLQRECCPAHCLGWELACFGVPDMVGHIEIQVWRSLYMPVINGLIYLLSSCLQWIYSVFSVNPEGMQLNF